MMGSGDSVSRRRPRSGPPFVIGLTMVKNEQDIIEPMLRHNAALLDAMIVLDNGSVDATRAIALSIAQELCNVVVTDSARFGYTQGERMTRLLAAAQSSFFADYVLFLDADEFIGAPGRSVFLAQLETIPAGGFGEMAWRNFVMTPETMIDDPPRGIAHRRVTEADRVVKTVLRLDGAFRNDLVVVRGSHAVLCLGAPLHGVALPDLPIWHFPVRSSGQLTAKALVGWMACLAANPHADRRGESFHWRDMYRRITDGPGFDGQDLQTLSLHYADSSGPSAAPRPIPAILHDPPPIDYVRRYSTGAPLDPLLLVARSWEQTLRTVEPLFAPEEAANETIDIPPLRFLVEKYQPASVLDIGCGNGLDLELFRRLGVQDLAGVGTAPMEALKLRHGGYVRHDPTQGFALSRSFSVVLCRHTVMRQDISVLVGNAERHAEGLIVFSLADGGASELADWLAGWRVVGWVPDRFDTLALRCLGSSGALRRGLVILRPMAVQGVIDGTEDLLAIAALPYSAPRDVPRLHEEPLLDAAEISWCGYNCPATAAGSSVEEPVRARA